MPHYDFEVFPWSVRVCVFVNCTTFSSFIVTPQKHFDTLDKHPYGKFQDAPLQSFELVDFHEYFSCLFVCFFF